jgi:hypothetical protein
MEQSRCPECGAINGKHNARRCTRTTLAEAQQQIIETEQRWIALNVKHSQMYHATIRRLKMKIDLLQGKVSVLKHENNQLRKSLKKQ